MAESLLFPWWMNPFSFKEQTDREVTYLKKIERLEKELAAKELLIYKLRRHV